MYNNVCCRSDTFCSTVIRGFDRQNRGTINFDDFIQSCVMLKSLTDSFRQQDTQQLGIVNISYENVSYTLWPT